MKNNKLRKALLLTTCALALVAISVGATLAYLTDTEKVVNTFTVGKVGITLNESDVYEENDTIPAGMKHGVDRESETRTNGNVYHLIPGYTYVKDPIVTVDAGSDSCYVFVKVENGIADIEATENTIADQIAANKWEPLDDVQNVFWKLSKKADNDRVLKVFESFTINSASNNAAILANQNDKVNVTAYAIQSEGFDTAALAWAAGNWN